MFTIFAVIFCIALTVLMTLGLAGAFYQHREALPLVGVLFILIVIFGVAYGS
jgi:hypothetical protein